MSFKQTSCLLVPPSGRQCGEDLRLRAGEGHLQDQQLPQEDRRTAPRQMARHVRDIIADS
jgi:hypothetical protein